MKKQMNKPVPGTRISDSSGLPRKARKADIKKDYRLTLQSGLIVSLLMVIGLFHMSFQTSGELDFVVVEQEIVEIEEIRQTTQIEQPPPPPRPPIPIEVPNEAILEEDFLVLDAFLDIDEPAAYIPAPPPPPPAEKEEAPVEAEAEIFVVVEEMPEIIGTPLHELVQYPELARKAGMEGLVVVKVVVEPDGSVSNPEILRTGGELLDAAAIDAVRQLKFKPGMQRGVPVRVSFAVPVRFRLRDAG